MSIAAIFSYVRVPVAVVSSIAASASGLLYWKQNELIYQRNLPPGARTQVPRPEDYPEPNFAETTEELSIPTPDGERLGAYLIRPDRKTIEARRSNNLTVLMFHGNAGNIGHRLPIATVLQNYLHCNILMLEYRGYGRSTGTPDEKGLNVDAQAGLDFIRTTQDLKNTGVVLFGQSLGGAVAIQLAARNAGSGEIKALILENTFTSIRKLIPTVLPVARYITPLCHQIWPSEETLPKITDIPILFLSGLQDEIVPNKILERFKEGDHNSTVACHGYFDAIELFLENYVI
ncbi:MAG: hypothetical protein M1828_000038 [Chrysothrix sp. TS-e1954]|nr:MAG: hypothetical protein M1828_000038 [Chrysothrix sp. TS-e1954]